MDYKEIYQNLKKKWYPEMGAIDHAVTAHMIEVWKERDEAFLSDVDGLIDFVSAITKVSRVGIVQGGTSARLVRCRHIVWWALLNQVVKTGFSDGHIAALFSKTHATVSIAKSTTIPNAIETDQEFREVLIQVANHYGMFAEWDGGGTIKVRR